MDEKRRMDDVIAARTEQKLDDFMSETRGRWKNVDNRLEKFDMRLENLESFFRDVNGPYKIIRWTTLVILVSFFGVIGTKIAHFIERHWH